MKKHRLLPGHAEQFIVFSHVRQSEAAVRQAESQV
jgi:hypothetical protein